MSAFEPIRVSTDDLPAAHRQDAVRDFFGRMMQRMDYAPLGEQESALSIERTPDLITDGKDDVLLSVMPTGCAVSSASGLAVEVDPGDILLCTINHPMKIAIPGADKRVVTLQMPRASLAGLADPIDDRPARAMPAAMPVLRLLFNYVNALVDLPLGPPDLRQKVALHVLDLAQLAIGPTRDKIEEGRISARAAKLALAKRITDELLSHPGLDATTMAERLGISTRYLRMLFEPEGTSFVDYLLDRRLEKACASLRDPRRRHRRIIDIASECGFADIRTFNRAVRKRFGMAPSDLRDQAASRA